MTVTLDDLKTAGWSDIRSGCYGSPEEVIELLSLLSFDSEDPRIDAVSEFGGSVYHQGDVYETTARAIPYVVEIIRSSEKRHLRLHAELLGWLAIFFGGVGVNYYKKPRETETVIRDVRQAVVAGLPAYLARLDDTRGDVRRMVLLLLGCLHNESQQILPLVQERYSVAINPVDRAAMLFCVGRLSPTDRQTLLFPRFTSLGEDEIVRLMVAINLAENKDDPLNPTLSKSFADDEPESPEEVRSYLRQILADYGKPRRSELDEQFAKIVVGEDLDVTIETLLGEE